MHLGKLISVAPILVDRIVLVVRQTSLSQRYALYYNGRISQTHQTELHVTRFYILWFRPVKDFRQNSN
jgi:hypothetical protein